MSVDQKELYSNDDQGSQNISQSRASGICGAPQQEHRQAIQDSGRERALATGAEVQTKEEESMNIEADTQQSGHERPENKKVTLTISTLSGDYTHDFPPHQKLQVVAEQTVHELKLEGPGPWILEHNGVELSLQQTIEQAGLKDGDIMTLNQEEGGGASERQ